MYAPLEIKYRARKIAAIITHVFRMIAYISSAAIAHRRGGCWRHFRVYRAYLNIVGHDVDDAVVLW